MDRYNTLSSVGPFSTDVWLSHQLVVLVFNPQWLYPFTFNSDVQWWQSCKYEGHKKHAYLNITGLWNDRISIISVHLSLFLYRPCLLATLTTWSECGRSPLEPDKNFSPKQLWIKRQFEKKMCSVLVSTPSDIYDYNAYNYMFITDGTFSLFNFISHKLYNIHGATVYSKPQQSNKTMIWQMKSLKGLLINMFKVKSETLTWWSFLVTWFVSTLGTFLSSV